MRQKLLLALLFFASLVASDEITDCEWDCHELDGQALQTFAGGTGPGGNKIEIARLDIQSGEYVTLANYPSLENVNAAVFWRDNVTHANQTMDKLFVAEGRDFEVGGVTYRKHYLVQICPSNNTFIRRAVLPDKTSGQMYYVASTSNDGTVWVSGGGGSDVTNINFADIATTSNLTISHTDTSPYSKFSMTVTGGGVNDLAWYEPCQTFIGLSSRGSDVSDTAVVLFDYPSQTTQSFTFPGGIDGPQDKHQGYGACYTFMEGDAVLCSGNGQDNAGDDNDIPGALYAIDMDPVSCEPRSVAFRVPTQRGSANDGTTCRFPGTLPCIPAYVQDSPEADNCALSRTMFANTPSSGGTGTWTQEAGNITVSFSNTSDPNAVVTAPANGHATLRWTLTDPLCDDDAIDNITVHFGSGCCGQDQYVSSNACVPCPIPFVNEAGDDPEGDDTECFWPVCPDHSVMVYGVCKCVTGYANDPVWTGTTWTDTCKKICNLCAYD